MLLSQPFFRRELPDGQRLISWRSWVLVWVLPVLFLLAAAGLIAEATYKQLATVPGNGEVVRVYGWPGETIFDRDVTNFSPVFRYQWSDGSMTEASTGNSHPDWNFAIGSRHAIRFFPASKANVVLPGPHNWFAAAVIGGIGLVTLIPSLLMTCWLFRWKAGAP